MKRKIQTALAALTALLLAAGAAAAVLPAGLRLGAGVDETAAALKDAGVEVRRLSGDAPQELAEGLLDSGLLRAMNLCGVKNNPFLKEASASPIAFLTGRRGGVFYAVGFVDGRSRSLFVRIPANVIPGKNPFDPSRLVPIRRIFDDLGAECATRPVERDRYGNAFRYRGACAGGTLDALYEPRRGETTLLVR